MTLLSLISEQTLPNLLVIEALKGVDRHVFLSTEKMERQGRSHWIRQAAKLRAERVEVIEVPAEDLEGVIAKLGGLQVGSEEEVILHLTGGTKLMALAAYQFVRERFEGRCQVVYQTLKGGQLRQLYPPGPDRPMGVKVNLETYLTVHGVAIEERGTFDLFHWETQANAIMAHLNGQRPSQEIARALQHDTHFEDLMEHKFYAGEWFEVWAYHQCRRHFGLEPQQIRQGVHLSKAVGNKSTFTLEYDLVFVLENRLFLLECKYWPGKSGFTANKANPDLRKLGHAKTQLGLYAQTAFWTANRISPAAHQAISPYLDFLGVRPADLNVLGNPKALTTELQQWRP